MPYTKNSLFNVISKHKHFAHEGKPKECKRIVKELKDKGYETLVELLGQKDWTSANEWIEREYAYF